MPQSSANADVSANIGTAPILTKPKSMRLPARRSRIRIESLTEWTPPPLASHSSPEGRLPTDQILAGTLSQTRRDTKSIHFRYSSPPAPMPHGQPCVRLLKNDLKSSSLRTPMQKCFRNSDARPVGNSTNHGPICF